MRYKVILTLILGLIDFFSCSANKYNLPTETIGNSTFYCYKVKAKETLYSISTKLGISQEEIINYNPSVVDGLKKDYVLFLPVDLFDNKIIPQSQTSTNNFSFKHTVKKGETLYGISKTYGISQEAITTKNPSVNNGIKPGQILIIPQVFTISENNEDNSEIIYHTIQKGETLYRLSKIYNTSIENILKLNPGITTNNFKIGVVIKITSNSNKSKLQEVNTTIIKPYIAQKGDNLRNIAKSQGVDYDVLKTANPNISKVKPGLTIQIPIDTIQTIEVLVSEGSESELRYNESERIQEIYDSIHNVEQNKVINIALLLPFMLNEQIISKQSQHYTEFYKGFLLAVNDIKFNNNLNINVLAYDIRNNLETLDSILCLPEIKKMDLIFAPENLEQLNIISDFCQQNNIYFVNTFSLKTDKYNVNPNMIQINTPQDYLLSNVCDWLEDNFRDHSIIFIHKIGTSYKELTKDIKSYFKSNGNEIIELEYNKVFTSDMLSEIMRTDKKYLIIPTSGSNSLMSHLILASKRLRSEHIDINFAVLGQPEWIIYVNDWKNNYHSVNTYLYSRFFADSSNYNIIDFENKFINWYGETPIQGTPTFSYLGYDLGRYFIEAMNERGNDFNTFKTEFKGLQSAIDLERISSWSGLINKSIFIINFNTDNNTYTIIK